MSKNMNRAGQSTVKRLRALFAAVALLVGSLAAPMALGFQPSGVCSMTCCVEAGHCCCNPRQAYVEGERPDGRPIITLADLSAPCPDGCTGSQSSSQLRLRDMDRAASPHLSLDGSPVAGSSQIINSTVPVESGNSSPRGPPILLG